MRNEFEGGAGAAAAREKSPDAGHEDKNEKAKSEGAWKELAGLFPDGVVVASRQSRSSYFVVRHPETLGHPLLLEEVKRDKFGASYLSGSRVEIGDPGDFVVSMEVVEVPPKIHGMDNITTLSDGEPYSERPTK